MDLQIIVSTMFQNDFSLLKKINVRSNAVIVNQCDENKIYEFDYNGFKITWINSEQRGLSKSRNLALKYANCDYVLLVDDDEVLVDNYFEIITNSFLESNADLITFNISSIGNKRKRYVNKRKKRLRIFNIFRYGSARIAFSFNYYKKHNLNFNEKYGAGTERKSGEDSLLLRDFLRTGAKCYANKSYIASIDDSNSTWFDGYNEKYYFNIGYFLKELFPKNTSIIIFIYTIKHKQEMKTVGVKCAYRALKSGAKENKYSTL